MLSDDEAFKVLNATLFQYNGRRMAEITEHTRFAHYTSAATAMTILQSKPEERSLWLRNATVMNDFSEVEYGQWCLRESIKEKADAERLVAACDAIHPGLIKSAASAMDEEAKRIKDSTYLLSLALHTGDELRSGNLAMWRAYGGDANVCLVLNTAAFTTPQTAYEVVLSPVLYDGPAGFKAELDAMVAALIENRDLLRQIEPGLIEFNLKRALDFAVMSCKHPAFREENEWRVIYREFPPNAEAALPSKVVCLDGIVQKVHFLPMGNVPDKGVANADLNELLSGIIIGPTPNEFLVWKAFVELLEAAGVTDAPKKVWPSGVPLRR